MKRIIVILCAVSLGAGSLAFAQTNSQFDKANEEYKDGNFQDAIKGYETLVRTKQWSATLFYDLGNAYFRTGDFGRAILNYERALALEPRQPETGANLQIARDEAHALELAVKTPLRSLQWMTLNQYTITAAIAFWIGIFGIVILIFARRRSVGLIALSILSMLVLLLSITALVWLDRGNKGRGLAIVTDKGVEARVATAENANTVLTLPPGSEIKIVSQRGDWIYAVLPNNLRGWIPAKSAESVRL